MVVTITVATSSGSKSHTLGCESFPDGMKKAFLWYEKSFPKGGWETATFVFRK